MRGWPKDVLLKRPASHGLAVPAWRPQRQGRGCCYGIFDRLPVRAAGQHGLWCAAALALVKARRFALPEEAANEQKFDQHQQQSSFAN
jgi:hypothetical protein